MRQTDNNNPHRKMSTQHGVKLTLICAVRTVSGNSGDTTCLTRKPNRICGGVFFEVVALLVNHMLRVRDAGCVCVMELHGNDSYADERRLIAHCTRTYRISRGRIRLRNYELDSIRGFVDWKLRCACASTNGYNKRRQRIGIVMYVVFQ